MSTILDRPPIEVGSPKTGKKRLHRRKAFWVAALVAPLAVLAAVYVAFFTPDSPAPLRLSPQAGSASEAPPGRWSVGSGSVAGYRVREKLLRLPASNDAVGRTSAIVGELVLDADSQGLVVRRGMRIVVDVSALQSDEPRRDDHMRNHGH